MDWLQCSFINPPLPGRDETVDLHFGRFHRRAHFYGRVLCDVYSDYFPFGAGQDVIRHFLYFLSIKSIDRWVGSYPYS